nr:hypothetical protein A4A49_17984 [Ipomoea trifida]
MNLQQIVAMSSSVPILGFALNSLLSFLSDQTSNEHRESLSKDSGNDAEIAALCSCVPLLGCALNALVGVLCDDQTRSEVSENAAAQQHFRQPQHVKGASMAS